MNDKNISSCCLSNNKIINKRGSSYILEYSHVSSMTLPAYPRSENGLCLAVNATTDILIQIGTIPAWLKSHWLLTTNTRFNHGFEVFNICCGPRLILMPQQTLNTKNLWFNVITHSKFISSPSMCLFSTIFPTFSPSFSSLYRDNIGVSTVEINVWDTCQSLDKLVSFLKSTGKIVGFFAVVHNKLLTREMTLILQVITAFEIV